MGLNKKELQELMEKIDSILDACNAEKKNLNSLHPILNKLELVKSKYLEKYNEIVFLAEQRHNAKVREEAKDYDAALKIWEKLGEINEAARVRLLRAELGSVKVSQSVVQGDQITNTEVRDSVISKSNLGSNGGDKFSKLERLAEMKEKGLIDDDEFKQMKKEILGKSAEII